MKHFFVVLSWGPLLALGVPDLPGGEGGRVFSIFFGLRHGLYFQLLTQCN